jgi:hypothetical protein
MWQEVDEEKKREMQVTHSCQTRTLVWITFSAIDFVGFMVYLAYLSKAVMPQLSRQQRVYRRFWLSLALAAVYVPFELCFNVWGTMQFKSNQFVNNSRVKHDGKDQGDPNALCKLNGAYQMYGILYMLVIYCQGVTFLMLFCMFMSAVQRFFDITDDIQSAE